MNKVYPLMAVLVTVSLGVGFAYAETFEDVVRFDLFNNATVSERGCYFTETESNGMDYVCNWHITTLNATQFFEEMKESFEEEIDDVREEQGLEPIFDDPLPVPLTPTERLIENLKHDEEVGRISTADTELLRLLEATKIACELGIEHGELIQQYAIFELPSIDPRIDTAVDYKANYHLGKIVQKYEECTAWNDYRYSHLGQRYLDIEKVGTNYQKTHREMVQTKETYPVPQLNEHSYAEADKQAKEWICSSSYYDYQYKKSTGCFELLPMVEGKGIMPNTESYRNYLEYLSGGTVDMSTLKKQEEQRVFQESLDSFAERMGIDADALKALVHNEGIDEYNESKIREAEKP